MAHRLLTVLFFLCIYAGTSLAQTYNVKRISGLEGLSQNTVNSICVDHVGYIWLGTDFGLNKYDGREIEKYHWNSENPNTIVDDNVYLVYEDYNKDIWVCTNKGVCLYNREQDIFSQNPLHLQNNHRVLSIYEDSTEIWFPAPDLSFNILNKTTRETRNLKVTSLINWERPEWKIIGIIEYSEDSILVLDEWKGLYLLHKNTGELSEFLSIDSKQYTDVRYIDNYIYLCSLADIFKISRNGKVVNTFLKSNPELLEPLPFKIAQSPYDGHIWIVTDYSGVVIVDENFKIIRKLESGPEPHQILPENSIKEICFLNKNTIILGSVRCGGIILYSSNIKQYTYNKRLGSGPSDVSILCIKEDRDNQIWIGTDGGGLNLFNRETNSFDYFETPEVKIVTSILDYSANKLLVASYQRGLYFFDKRTKQFTEAKNYTLFKSINRNVRHKLFRDSKNNIWISDGGIVKINPTNKNYKRYDEKSNGDFFRGIVPIYFTVYESKFGKLWFGTIGGFFSYSLITNKFVDRIFINDIDSSAGNTVFTIVEDKNDDLILATSKGLYHYSLETKTLKPYIEDPSYKNKRYSSLYIDENDYLWAGTNDALLRIKENGDKKEILAFNNIGFGGGKEYRHDAVLRSSDNLLYLGSNNGIASFVPERAANDEVANKVIITSLKKMGNKRGELMDSTFVTDCMQHQQITFKYSPSTYKLTFNAFNIPLEELTEYEYTLENFEDYWHRGKENTATYTNLSTGEYIFKVRSTNKNGQWSNEVSSIGIKILPPWYETIWFWTSVIFMLSIVIFIFWRGSLVRLKLKHQIEIQETQQKQLKERNQYKLQFFTNISHELKTPLTLIYSPLQRLINRNTSAEEIKLALPSLFRNVRRMMMIIDQLLEFRKAEVSSLKVNARKVNCVEVCQEAIEYFEYYAKAEKVELKLISDDEKMEVELDYDKFSKILFNLISNALKHSNPGNSVLVFLTWDNEQILIKVKDFGSGIPLEAQEHIFDCYYQVEENLAGTGIGLTLTKQLVEIHGGSIKVESEEGEGATFSVWLPKKQYNKLEETIDIQESTFTKNSNNSLPSELKLNVKNEIKILVVEDEGELRHFLENELSSDYLVHTARNGKDGFDKALQVVPELIVSDVMMPVMNGYELCEKIRNNIEVSHIPMILLTAKTENEHQAEGYSAGVDLYVPKPFDMRLLKLQISGLIKNRQILKTSFFSNSKIQVDKFVNNSLDKEFIEKAINLVEDNMDNQHFKVADFVSSMGMSRSLVYNKVNAITGKPVKDFILHIKLQRAANILTTTDTPISDVAYACGFSDPNYFSTVFKRYYSKSPMAFRAEI